MKRSLRFKHIFVGKVPFPHVPLPHWVNETGEIFYYNGCKQYFSQLQNSLKLLFVIILPQDTPSVTAYLLGLWC